MEGLVEGVRPVLEEKLESSSLSTQGLAGSCMSASATELRQEDESDSSGEEDDYESAAGDCGGERVVRWT